MASIFTKIIQGELPCYKIAEDDKFLAFLDVNPLVKGHTLVVPKIEIDYIFDLEDTLLSEMMICSKRVALKIEKAILCTRIEVAVIGLEVPHTHVHLVPMQSVEDINFTQPKLSFSAQEMEETLIKITN